MPSSGLQGVWCFSEWVLWVLISLGLRSVLRSRVSRCPALRAVRSVSIALAWPGPANPSSWIRNRSGLSLVPNTAEAVHMMFIQGMVRSAAFASCSS